MLSTESIDFAVKALTFYVRMHKLALLHTYVFAKNVFCEVFRLHLMGENDKFKTERPFWNRLF